MSLLDDIDPIFLQETYYPLRNHDKTRVVAGKTYRNCNMCKKWLSLENYSVHTSRSFLSENKNVGHQCSCKKCMASYCSYYNKKVRRLKLLSQSLENK